MRETVMKRYLMFVLLIFCCTSLFAKENDYTAQIDLVLQRLIEEYPPSGTRLPESFAQNKDVKQLIQLINADFELYLSATHIIIPLNNYKIPELSEEEREIMSVATSSSGTAWQAARDKRTEEEYKLFKAKLGCYMKKFRIESRKREILRRSLTVWALNQKAFLIRQLNHHNWHIRIIARDLLYQFLPKERDVIDALLKMLPPEYPYYEGGLSGKKNFLVENPVIIVGWLSRWRIPEVLPYVQKLGKHPFFHYRRDSMKYIKRYGIQESIPHMIKLLNDEAGLIRAEAFNNLALLTGTGMGQKREFWHNENLKLNQKTDAIAAWTEWWERHGKRIAEVEFHRAVIERAFALMEKHGAWDSDKKCSAQPVRILQEHLNSGISTRQRSNALASEFRIFWRQNKASLYFDRVQQKFILLESKKEKLQQATPTDAGKTED